MEFNNLDLINPQDSQSLDRLRLEDLIRLRRQLQAELEELDQARLQPTRLPPDRFAVGKLLIVQTTRDSAVNPLLAHNISDGKRSGELQLEDFAASLLLVNRDRLIVWRGGLQLRDAQDTNRWCISWSRFKPIGNALLVDSAHGHPEDCFWVVSFQLRRWLPLEPACGHIKCCVLTHSTLFENGFFLSKVGKCDHPGLV